MVANYIKSIEQVEQFLYDYTICTLVTNMNEYQEMLRSFSDAGFINDRCEFLYIDNCNKNTFDAFSGLNRFLREAKGRFIIICHQDILLIDDDIVVLDERVKEISSLDPQWAILGNSGGVNIKHRVMHVTRGNGKREIEKLLPIKVQSVDENFIVVRNSANLALSADLCGFHLYGVDLCLIADILGFSAYVIEFNVLHKSDGNADIYFYKQLDNLKNKYTKGLRDRFMSTTITRFYLSGSILRKLIYNSRIALYLARQYCKLFSPKMKFYKPIKTKNGL